MFLSPKIFRFDSRLYTPIESIDIRVELDLVATNDVSWYIYKSSSRVTRDATR